MISLSDKFLGVNHVRSVHVPYAASSCAEKVDTQNFLRSLGFKQTPCEGLCLIYFLFQLYALFRFLQVPVELNRNASFKEVRQLLGRWMGTEPDNASLPLLWPSVAS